MLVVLLCTIGVLYTSLFCFDFSRAPRSSFSERDIGFCVPSRFGALQKPMYINIVHSTSVQEMGEQFRQRLTQLPDCLTTSASLASTCMLQYTLCRQKNSRWAWVTFPGQNQRDIQTNIVRRGPWMVFYKHEMCSRSWNISLQSHDKDTPLIDWVLWPL